jgi:hypothetical protein
MQDPASAETCRYRKQLPERRARLRIDRYPRASKLGFLEVSVHKL